MPSLLPRIEWECTGGYIDDRSGDAATDPKCHKIGSDHRRTVSLYWWPYIKFRLDYPSCGSPFNGICEGFGGYWGPGREWRGAEFDMPNPPHYFKLTLKSQYLKIERR